MVEESAFEARDNRALTRVCVQEALLYLLDRWFRFKLLFAAYSSLSLLLLLAGNSYPKKKSSLFHR